MSPRTWRRRLFAWWGGGALLLIALTCLLTLPYSIGRVERIGGSAGAAPRRYEAVRPEIGLLPPFWAPHAADEAERVAAHVQRTGERPRPLLGTDRLGRDVLARCLAGGAVSLGVGISAAAIAVVIGTIWGTIAGAAGGRTDALMMRTVDVIYGLPSILLVVLLAVAVEGIVQRGDAAASARGVQPPVWVRFAESQTALLSAITLLVAIGAVSWLTMARVIRGQVMSLRQRPFMEACRALGIPLRRQFTRHLLPNLLGPIIVYATLTVPQAILSESFLSFLGIGIREPLPSWGNLAAAGLSELNVVRVRWWLLLWPCLMIAVTLLALNFAGEALRERADPRRVSAA